MPKKEYFYPAWLRIWHLLNAVLFCFLIVTGLSMQYSSPDFNLIAFDISVSIHNICGIILTMNYLFFIIGNLISGNGKQYLPRKAVIKNSIIQTKYYISGMFKKQPHPFQINKDKKFNPLQQITYLQIMYFLLPFFIVTGWGLFFPELILKDVIGISGLLLVDLIHIALGFIMTIFMIGHIYLATIGKKPSSNFKAIITGWHEVEEE